MKKAFHWIHDYFYAIRGEAHSYIYRKPPTHYLSHRVANKCPVILIPGLHERWNVFSRLAHEISQLGHPIYVITDLGRNIKDIPSSGKLVHELMDQEDIKNAVVIAHSKGGLIGKFCLANCNSDHRIKKLITIATPFGGVAPVKYIPIRHFKELSPGSKIIEELKACVHVNRDIVSIYPVFDNHIWPLSSAHLDGATNIQVPVHGHHKILHSKLVLEKILKILEEK